jgi:hypothetical protein
MALEGTMDLSKERPYGMSESISRDVIHNTLRLFTIFLGISFKFHSHFYTGTIKPNYMKDLPQLLSQFEFSTVFRFTAMAPILFFEKINRLEEKCMVM